MTQFYEIKVKGQLGSDWSDWFDGLAINHKDEDITVITGYVQDQAALHGLLVRVRDLGLPLLSLNAIAPQTQKPDK